MIVVMSHIASYLIKIVPVSFCVAFFLPKSFKKKIDLYGDKAAILNSIVQNNYYGMPVEHLIIAIWSNRIQNGHRIAELRSPLAISV